MLKDVRSTGGWFLVIPFDGPGTAHAVRDSLGLHGAVVEADTHLNEVAVANMVYAPKKETA